MDDLLQSLPWLQPGWSQLSRYINQDRVPQALLIIGNKGLGKQRLANFFAQSLMCSSALSEGAYCGKCRSCILFKANTHPDYLSIAPEEAGKAIAIDTIRQLTNKLTLKPQFDKYRPVVIDSADCLNSASANAFLKYLEEPTERTCLILITDRPSKLPATVRSRCQKLEISISDQGRAKTWLKQQGITENIDLLLSMSQGSPLFAKQLSDNSALSFRAECFVQWLKRQDGDFISIAEQWSKLDKEKMDLLLFWLISWVMDMIKLRCSRQSVQIINIDLITDLQEIVNRLDLKRLYKYYDFLLLSRQRLDTQLNKQLLFEEILIQWSELNSG